MHFHYRVTFTGYIRCFCATTSHGLVTLTFNLLTLRVFRVQRFSCPTHIPISIILRLSVTELRVLNIWSHFRYLKQSLRMRRVTWPLTGGKIVYICEISLTPICLFTFVTFRALRRRLSHVIGRVGILEDMALASKVKSLALASASDAKSLAFGNLFPVLVLGFEPKTVNSYWKPCSCINSHEELPRDLFVIRPAVSRLTQTPGKLCSMSRSSPSYTASSRGSSAHRLPQHQWNVCSVTVVSSWDHTEREWGTRCCRTLCSWSVISMCDCDSRSWQG